MGRYSGKSCRLIAMLSLTFSFFLVEITIGFMTKSLALVGDSYHMLSDVVALCIGLAAVRVAKWSSPKNTFGWARAEVLGALVNSVFLVALCFTIFVEALQRLVEPEKIENPNLLLITGGLGLLINVIGLILFSGHAHGHSHGGGGHGHSHANNHNNSDAISDLPAVTDERKNLQVDQKAMNEHGDSEEEQSVEIIDPKTSKSSQLNMRGVFLHVLGDALGSVVVVISALVIKFVGDDQEWKYRIDPAMSLIMITIIVCTTAPLFKEASMILLQTVPTNIMWADLQQKLISTVEGVLDVHELHIWRLTGNRVIASAHILCHDLRDYMRIAQDVKDFFHNEGIHSTTIQPEFLDYEEVDTGRRCMLECGPDKLCFPDTCCGKRLNGTIPLSSPMAIHRQNTAPTRSLNDAGTEDNGISLLPKSLSLPRKMSLEDFPLPNTDL